MKKIILLTLALVLVFSLTACGGTAILSDDNNTTTPSLDSPLSPSSNNPAESDNLMPSTTPTSNAPDNTPSPNIPVTNTAMQAVSDIDTSKIQGKIQNIFYLKVNQVLIIADKLYLYDLYSGSVIRETSKPKFVDEKYIAINNGFAAIGISENNNSGGGGGMMTTSANNTLSFVIYDMELNKKTEINGDMLMSADEIFFSLPPMSVSADGNKIAYATFNGLYLYDIAESTKVALIDLQSEDAAKRFGLTSIEQVEFTNNDNVIVFKSNSFDVPAVMGKQSFDTYGTININGSGLSVKKSADFSVKQIIAYDSFMFLTEDFTTASGKVMSVDSALGNAKTFTTATKKESGSVFGSENGDYFATALTDGKSVTVRVYDRKSGVMVMEEVIVKDSLYMAREPVVRVFDDMKTCIVLLGNRQQDISTICLVFNF